jgi:hypothetical protein
MAEINGRKFAGNGLYVEELTSLLKEDSRGRRQK